jgi:hypothetical protein
MIMDKQTEDTRNRPTEKGDQNDPNVKDYSAIEPHVSTVSSSDTDKFNEDLTETASDGFRTDTGKDKNADKTFDEIDTDHKG